MIFMLSDLTIVQVIMKVMVNNFVLLSIKYCFLNGLSDILLPDTVMRFNKKLIKEIAAEIENSQTEKARTLRKLRNLEISLQTLNRFGRYKIVNK